MSFRAKRELLAQVAPRYREVGHPQKSVVLDEFVAATGYARKYAIRLLAKPVPTAAPIRRPRAPRYGPAVCEALQVAWTTANEICSKRLVPFLPELVEALERHGHLQLTADVRPLLLTLSPATADRLLRPARQPHGLSTTKPGRLLKQQIPVRTFADWSDVRPGFLEADLVAHCGGVAEGAFLYTLTLTDIVTTWTECLPLLHRTQEAVVQAVERARQLLPFPLLGFDTDNGSEFLNEQLFAYCAQEQITFTRGRTANKNDQCYVEQKNGAVVRQLVGYERFEGERAYRQLAELYRAVRLYVNFFQPSLKLLTKQRDGGHVRRTYGPARTPFQRVLATDVLPEETRARLTTLYQALDPVRLLRQIRMLQEALGRHAVFGRTGRPSTGVDSSATDAVRFDGRACGLDGTTSAEPTSPARAHDERGTRGRRKPLGPRTWRTRPDPFAAVWDELVVELTAHPERTAKDLLTGLQTRYPGQYADSVLRTLQHRVKAWRASVILTFDTEWLANDPLAGAVARQQAPTAVAGGTHG
jgi:hypothetical protein